MFPHARMETKQNSGRQRTPHYEVPIAFDVTVVVLFVLSLVAYITG